MRRRSLIQGTIAAAAAPLIGSCQRETPAPGTRLILTTAAGVCVLDLDGRIVRGPLRLTTNIDWAHAGFADVEAIALAGELEPRINSLAGTEIASVTPGGAGVYGLHDPRGRERTTIVVSDARGERARLDLPGNVEPEAFSPGADRLFVLDFQPASKPDRYRHAVVDLATGRMTPVDTEETATHRVQRLHDAHRHMLYCVCVDEAQNASVHCLNLAEGWARRIALPKPFGQNRPGTHAIAVSGDRLSVIHTPSARLAELDPDQLAIKWVDRFAPSEQDGKPGFAFTRAGRAVIAVDGRVFVSDPAMEIPTPGEVRGLVLDPAGRAWVGNPEGVVQLDLDQGRELRRVAVPGLYVLKHVREG